MSLPRRDFMKSLGISIGSILLAGYTQPNDPQASAQIPTQTPSFNTQTNMEVFIAERYSTSAGLFPQKPTPQIDEVPTENSRSTDLYSFNDPSLSPRARLRHCWFYLSWLARRYEEGPLKGEWARSLLITSHRAALVELIVAGKMCEAIARDVQKGFDAAVSHVNSSNVPAVCYD